MFIPDGCNSQDVYAGHGSLPRCAVSLQRSLFTCYLFRFSSRHRAQEEISRVVGQRIPTFEDRINLPYVQAVLQETYRWHPAVLLGKQTFC